MEPSGTVYQGPAVAASGTVYGGTVYDGPAASVPAARPVHGEAFETGKILGLTFSTYFSNFIPFVLLTALALSPLYLMQVFFRATTLAASPTSSIASVVFLFVSVILCPYIATSAITFGVFQQMRGQDTSIGECLSRGLSCLFPVLGLSIVQGLRIFVGYLLCLVPGIVWSLQLAVSIPAEVEERPGISGAMERSRFLTEGYRGDIFGVLFVLGILGIGVTLVVTLGAGKNQDALLLLTGLADLLFVGLRATATAVMYYRLRSIKESIDVDQISSVFA
jgi:hypothetical protein